MKLPKALRRRKPAEERVFIVPTRYGFLYGFLVFILIALSTIFSNSDLLLASAILVTFGVVCAQQTHLNIVSLNLQDVDPQSGFVGEETPWRIKIKNAAGGDSYSVNIGNTNFDFPARELLSETIFHLGRQRGLHAIEQLKISTTYPLGLFYAWKYPLVTKSYYTYPAILAGEALASLRDQKSKAETRDDFVGHREFQRGDSARQIDWKVQARQRRLMVKLFESADTQAYLLDWHKLPVAGVEEKLSWLAGAVFECHRQQKPFGLILPQVTIPVGEGAKHYARCLQQLATFDEAADV